VQQESESKSIFSTIGETLGLSTSTPSQSPNSNNKITHVQTNIKSECEGEDCDIFTNSNQVTEIVQRNLGNNFNNPELRFKRARNEFNNLIGKQIKYSKRNIKGNLANVPQTGDAITYFNKT